MIRPTEVFDALVAAGYGRNEAQDWVNEATRAKHTLRDDFAKVALTGILSHPGTQASFVDVAAAAWALADVMIEGRHKQ
jgi:hypothetical protein